MFTTRYLSPLGTLTLASDQHGLRHLIFPGGSRTRPVPESWQLDDEHFQSITLQLDEYFAGERRTFDLPLSPVGTEFQRSVWAELSRIDYASTCSYGQIAERIGLPKASRAVGAANGANPIPIIIPCHRVIGANGNLTGFGGGLPTKQWLLAHEHGEQQLIGLANT